jgi:nicotianamine synthase
MNVRAIYQELSRVPSLRPSPGINELFARLVDAALARTPCPHGLSPDEVARLQALCGAGEYELERFWAEAIRNAGDPHAALKRFPYFHNYVTLANLEWSSLAACSRHRTHSVLFCGGGPLPLTAILLALEHGVRSTVIDAGREAVALSRRVVAALGLDRMLAIVHADARTYRLYRDYNTVFVAALAGADDCSKREIFKRIRLATSGDTHVMARSSWGNRALLYRPLPEAIYRELVPVAEVRPDTDVVNSIVIFRSRSYRGSRRRPTRHAPPPRPDASREKIAPVQ